MSSEQGSKSVEVVSDRVDSIRAEIREHYATKNELSKVKITVLLWVVGGGGVSILTLISILVRLVWFSVPST